MVSRRGRWKLRMRTRGGVVVFVIATRTHAAVGQLNKAAPPVVGIRRTHASTDAATTDGASGRAPNKVFIHHSSRSRSAAALFCFNLGPGTDQRGSAVGVAVGRRGSRRLRHPVPLLPWMHPFPSVLEYNTCYSYVLPAGDVCAVTNYQDGTPQLTNKAKQPGPMFLCYVNNFEYSAGDGSHVSAS